MPVYPPQPPSTAALFFDSYEPKDQGEPPPWDIDHPQAAFVEAAAQGHIVGPVLDVGCGTGEIALHFASLGVEVVGIDMVPRAVEVAREKGRARGLTATFSVGDALDLGALGRRFRTVTDSGVFHGFDEGDRALYVKSLRSALVEGGRYFMLAFSEAECADWGGPKRIRRAEIEEAFRDGWRIHRIDPSRYETRLHATGSGHAYLSEIEPLAIG